MAKKQTTDMQRPVKQVPANKMPIKKNRLPSIKGTMLGFNNFFIIALLLTLGVTILITYLSLVPEGQGGMDLVFYRYLVLILAGILAILAIVLIIINAIAYNTYFKSLFDISKNVVDNFAANKKDFPRYPSKKVQEFEELNYALDKTEAHLSRSVVYSKDGDYSSLDLPLSSNGLGTIKFRAFERSIPEIIMLSQAYRNAFVHLYYGEKLDILVGQSLTQIIDNAKRIFNYPNILIANDSDKTGFIVYIPQIDSINHLKDECEMFIKCSSMVKNTPNGKALVVARTSVVIYPYSDIEDIISDLRYADRQSENVNYYFPERASKKKADVVLHGAYSLNRANQLVSTLASVKIEKTYGSDVKATIREQLNKFGLFINADYVGVIMRDDSINKFVNYVAINNRKEIFLKEGETIGPELLQITQSICDQDGSYFFSTRSRMDVELGNYLDKAGIGSGFVYVVSDDNGALGLIYLLNYQRDMHLDSYLHESTFSIAYQIGAIIRETTQLTRLKSSSERSDILMKLTNYMSYAIDKNSYDIVDISDTFIDTFGKCKNKKCYKAIYGLKEPCENCPIKTQTKMIQPFKDVNYETSLILSSNVENVTRMLIRPLDIKEGHNRFDPDFLINSYHALNEDLRNIYSVSGRGYVILLNIENAKDILTAYGNEGYTTYIRKFADHMNERFEKDNKFYVYDNTKIALILPDSGSTEVIDVCEKLYTFSREVFIELDNKEFIPMTINYLAVRYPQEFPTHADLLRHCEQVLTTYKHKDHLDEIYFEDTEYFRSASRSKFISEVIEKSFKEGSFKVNLQPILQAANKHIMGAEILIRLSDDYRGQALSAFEVIKAAAEQNKISIISNGLINYIGDIYQKYGLTLFKTRNFTRLSLNTDYSFFSDENFLRNISILVSKYAFPKNFLAFEIVEHELSDHYEAFRSICSKLKLIGVHMTVDQYTGKYLSLDKIKALDIPEVKIPRNLIRDIDVNQASLKALNELVSQANKLGLIASVVGVENKDQYMLIRDMTRESLMQGYFFYAPLELPQLIEAVKVN
ncbi:MAG: EAL domain-containing protein [Bacilli bacterium]|nr:EAL domain-containing protein [Bacilli bacterium]